MQITGARIRDLGRVLPWMASPPPGQPERLTDVLTREALAHMTATRRNAAVEALINACEHRRAGLAATIEKMAAEFRRIRDMDVENLMNALADPHGEATDSCESAEAYFREQREDLWALRNTLLSSGGLEVYGPRVFLAIDALHTTFGLAISCMQEGRWLVLMAEGGRDAPSSSRTFTSGAALIAAIEAEDAGPEAV